MQIGEELAVKSYYSILHEIVTGASAIGGNLLPKGHLTRADKMKILVNIQNQPRMEYKAKYRRERQA